MILIQRIVVPTDFSECARQALRYASAVAERFGAELVLLHAIESPRNLPPQAILHLDPEGPAMPPMDSVQQAAERRMEALAADLGRAGLRASWRVEVGDVRDVVLEGCASLRADLVVMGTHGRTGLRHLLLGSIAEDIVRRSAVPVLTVRHREEPAAGAPAE